MTESTEALPYDPAPIAGRSENTAASRAARRRTFGTLRVHSKTPVPQLPKTLAELAPRVPSDNGTNPLYGKGKKLSTGTS